MKKSTQSILVLTSLLLSTLDLRRLVLKQQLSYLSLLFAIAFTSPAHAQDGVLIIGTPAAFNSGVMSTFMGENPPSQPNGGQANSPSFIEEQKAKARLQCKAAAEATKLDCEKARREDYTSNVGICNTYLGVPGAFLTGAGVMDALKKGGWKGKMVAGLGATVLYGATACKDWAGGHRDEGIAQCAIDLSNQMNNVCNKI